MQDPTDDRGIPISAGIPPIIFISALVGLIIIFTMGTMVFLSSGSNHIWPNTKAVEIKL